MGKLNQWNPEEDEIIKTSFDQFKTRKWKNISKILSAKGYERGEAECRERYVNHLDPALEKNHEITQDQLETLYDKYQIYGPKWCLIQTFIPNRTQIKIKNIFYGNIRLFLKKLYKHFSKKTAVFINQLKTDDLQTIYDGTEEFTGFNLIKKGFKKVLYKINQQTCNTIISANEQQYFQLLNKILEYKTNIRPLQKKLDFSGDLDSSLIKEQTNKLLIEKKSLTKESVNMFPDQINKQNNNKTINLAVQNIQEAIYLKTNESPVTTLNQFPTIYNFPQSSNFYFGSISNGNDFQNFNMFMKNYYHEQPNFQMCAVNLWPLYHHGSAFGSSEQSYMVQNDKVNQTRSQEFIQNDQGNWKQL